MLTKEMENDIVNIYDDTINPYGKCELVKVEWNKYCNHYKKKINLNGYNIALSKSNYECTNLMTNYYACYITHIKSKK